MGKKENRSKSVTIIFIIIYFFQFLNISAQVEIPDSVIMERIHLIENMLIKGKPNSDRWWYGWLAGYSAATIVQGSVFLSSNNEGLREDMALGAVTTLLGAAGQLLTPLLPSSAPGRLSKIPENTHEERLQKLNEAEELLKACALREKSGRSWKVHAVTSVVNIGSGLVTWLGYERNVRAGVENF
ncbi:MAG: hypothetical protein EPN88_01025, partial [Bacteroidetes bacterium]